MPQAGVSVPRGRLQQEQAEPERVAEERFDDRPFTGPLPVRAGTADDDWELAQRAVAASPRPTRSAQRAVADAPRPASSAVADAPRPTRSAQHAVADAPRPARSARPARAADDDRESLRNARAAIASWEQAGHAHVDSWDVPSRTRPAGAVRRGAPASPPDGAVRRAAQASPRGAAAEMPGTIRAPRPTPLPRSAMTTGASTPAQAAAGIQGRRTVQITGRGTERYNAGFERRRPQRRPHEREGFRPDRAAMWAVLLGFVLVLVAATSSHAAVLAHHIH
jgi:hypothetical protein